MRVAKSKHGFLVFLLLILLLSKTSFLWSQNPHLLHFTVDDGLPSSFLYRSFQDSRGYVWVCSDMGVARFDGYTFETFTTSKGLLYNDVWDFSEDSHGRIWLHTYLPQFSYFDYADQKMHHLHHGVSYGSSIPIAFHEWQGDVWASTQSRTLINTRTGREIQMEHCVWGLHGHTTSKLLYTQDQEVYDSRHELLQVLQQNLGKSYRDLTVKNVFDECWGNEQRFVYSKNDSIFLDTPTFCAARSIAAYTNIANNHLARIDIISDNKLLVVTQQAVFVLNQNLERLSAYDFLQDYDVNAVFEDREGNLWITTKNNGLYMLNQEALKNRLFTPSGSQQIRSIAADPQGRIFLSSSDGYIYYLDNNQLHTLPLGIPFWGHIRQIFITPDQLLIAACNNHTLFVSLSDLDSPKKQFSVPTSSQAFQFRRPQAHEILYWEMGIKKIEAHANRQISLSASQSAFVLTACSEAQFCVETWFNGIRNYALAQDSLGHLFIGTHTGIRTLQNGQLDTINVHYPYRSPLKAYINDLKIDCKGNLWVASNGAGLYYLSPQQQHRLLQQDSTAYTLVKGLNNRSIKNLFIDEQATVWASTNQGVYEIQLLPDNPQPHIRQWSLTQGLPTNETFSVYATDTTLYVGTGKGLAQINRGSLPPPSSHQAMTAPFLYFTDFSVNKIQRPLPAQGKTSVWNYQENNIDISYVCLSYRSNQQITYYYRMLKDNDHNTPWQTTTALHREFPLASPANYRFELKARDTQGNETPVQQLTFSILPPWWQQTWFRGIALVVFISILWTIYQLRIRFVRRQEQLRNEFAAMRLQILQSQMNPHFMNNALNAIQLFIARSDSFSANEYLAKFATLNRLYLEASRRRFIPLVEELELLQTYLDLESLRFPQRFSYHINIQPHLLTKLQQFPAMFLQPLAENAINHGILYLQRPGTLTIDIVEQNNLIICLIDDDGIGRAAANAIKAKFKKTHISRGMQIIEELQNTVNLHENMQIYVDIIDKTDEQGNAKGTLVKISLRYLQ